MSDTAETGGSKERFLLDWFPWLILTRSFSLATAVHVMLLALVGAMATCAGWRMSSWLLTEEYLNQHPLVRHDVHYFGTWPGERIAPTLPLNGKPVWADLWREDRLGNPPEDPLRAVPVRMTIPWLRFLHLEQSGWGLAYYLAGLAWTIIVWAFFGSAISRMAAVKFAVDERVELRDAVQHARNVHFQCLLAYCLPILGIAALAVPIAVLGLMMRLDLGVVFGGVLWALVVTFSFLMVLLAIGLLIGWPLMWSAISVDGSDAFDAVSRAYAYAFQRPIRFLCYLLYAASLGLLGWFAIWWISEGMISLGAWAASLGAGRERIREITDISRDLAPATGLLWFGSKFVGFWNLLIRTIATAYAYSYFFTAMTGIYLILRQDVDGTELDWVHFNGWDEQEGNDIFNSVTNAHGSTAAGCDANGHAESTAEGSLAGQESR